MNQSNPLESAAVAFKHWRDNRRHIRERCPDSLRQTAVNLLQDFSIQQVAESLDVSTSLLRDWRRKLNAPKKDSLHDTAFVMLPEVSQPPPATAMNTLQLAVSFSNGAQLTLSGDIPASHLMAVMQGLGESKGGDA